MMIGERTESFSETVERHIAEMENDIKQWQQELKYAEENGDEQYAKYVQFWIKTCNNTLSELKDYS